MDKLTRAFTRLDAFLADFTPLTPYGRARKADNPFYANAAELEREFDRTEMFLLYLKSSGPNAEKLAWHLKRMPRLELPFPLRFDCAELFEIKKFLYNARAAFVLLDEPLRDELSARLDCADLWALLARDGEPESFFLAAEPDSELERVRGLIAALDRDMAAVKTARCAEIKERCGLDFSERSFIVLDAARAAALPEAEAFVEPHDARTVIVRPAYGKRYAALAARREELDAAEKTASVRALETISAAVRAAEDDIAAAVRTVELVDTLLAKARLAAKYRLVRPGFSERGAVTVEAGEFVPLKNRLAGQELKYTPLNCSFKKPVALLYGSNMGGKTVALQTVGFLQLLAQGGFFVPAKKFETRVFEAVRFVGAEAEPGQSADDGLSGFGREVAAFNAACPDIGRRTLLLVDEFARTTNSREACALLSAVVELLGGQPDMLALVSTHFAGVARGTGTAVYRMRGFDRAAYDKYSGTAGAAEERLRAINRFMRYQLIDDDGSRPAQDALSVATALGLDPRLIALAQKNMEK